MKPLIVYASKTETAEKCAKEINIQLKNSKMVNMLNQKVAYFICCGFNENWIG